MRLFLLITKYILCLYVALLLCNPASAQRKNALPDSVGEEGIKDERVDDDADEEGTTTTAATDTAVLRTVPDSTVAALKAKKSFAYANDPEYWVREEEKSSSADPRWFAFLGGLGKILLYALVVLLVVGLIQLIVQQKMYLFFKKPKRLTEETIQPDEEEIPKDLDAQIEASLSNAEYRKAVRFMYLKAIVLGSEKEIFQPQARNTNQTYIRQLGNHPQSNNFKFLTNAYEYVWFGGFEPSAEQFAVIQQSFQQFYNSI